MLYVREKELYHQRCGEKKILTQTKSKPKTQTKGVKVVL